MPSSQYRRRVHPFGLIASLLLSIPASVQAQRGLHWDSVDVVAHLAADGRLRVTETQTLVLSGDWNGGERRFDIRPRQQLTIVGVDRIEAGASIPLNLDASLASVDDYALTGRSTLRWRSRLPSDPPFENTSLTYTLRYEMANIVEARGEAYVLNHDFLFAEREGEIARASVVLTLDPEWQPQAPVAGRYTVESLEPGRGLIVTIPLRYAGTGTPVVLDGRLPRPIVMALWALLLLPVSAVAWTMMREHRDGRFAPLHDRIDEEWIREHIVSQPAEVVAAMWDNEIGSSEVVALIARLTAEGKLKSDAAADSMTLQLAVKRDAFTSYERTLIDALFFDNRQHTTTALVREHYLGTGFNPAAVIRKDLAARVDAAWPEGRHPRRRPLVASVLFFGGASLAIYEWWGGRVGGVATATLIGAAILASAVAAANGRSFRANIQWKPVDAWRALLPASAALVVAALVLVYLVAPGTVAASQRFVVAVVMLALWVVIAATDAMRSNQHRAALAVRKRLAAGREYFVNQLRKERPALRDDWFPWILAFGLGEHVDDWSARSAPSHASPDRSLPQSSNWVSSPSASGSTDTASTGGWTGAGGGRSGGAGGSASWGRAATAFAAPVAAPGSGSGSDSSSSSSSSSSSGGGGGGGW